MTGLTKADIQRVIDGFMWTRKVDARGALCHKDQDAEQETRIIAALRDETDTRMLLDVARQDGARDRAALEWIESRSCLPSGVTIATTAWDEKYKEHRSVYYGGVRDRRVMVSWGPKMGHFRRNDTLMGALESAMRLSAISPE